MTQGYNESSTQIFYGLSSDTKPTGCDNGSIFIEMDTKIGYIYDADNAEWTEIPNGGGSQVEMDYNEATNKPAINDVTLSGNKTPASLGLQTKINSDSMLDADLVDDTNSDNKFVSATDIVNWNGKADADDVYTKTHMDTALAGKQPVIDDLSDIRSGAALGATSLQPSDVKSTYSSSGTDPVNGKAVAAAIGTLDVAAVGGSGSFISGISETNGKISATAGTVDSTPTESSTGLVTSAGIYTDQARQDALEAQDRAALIEVENKGAKNLLQNSLSSDTVKGITYTINADGSITTTAGTASGGNSNLVIYFDLEPGVYVVSGCPNGGSSTTYRAQVLDNTTSTSVALVTDSTTGAEFEVVSGHEYAWRFRVQENKSIPDTTFYPMICAKAQWDISHTYVPYGKTNADLTAEADYAVNTGAKNIFDIQANATEQRTTTVLNPDGGITISCNATAWATRNVIAEIPAGDYICSLFIDTVTIGGGTFAFFVNQSNDQSTWTELARQTPITSIGRIDKTITVTQKYLRISTNLNNSDTSATNSATIRLMIRSASISDTSFQPYARSNPALTAEMDYVVNAGAKNLLNVSVADAKANAGNTGFIWSGNTASKNHVSFEIKDDLTVYVKSDTGYTASDTTIFYLTDGSGAYPNTILNGCPSGGSRTTYEIRTATPVKSDYGSGVEITSDSTTNVVIIIRSGWSGELTFKPMIRPASITDATFQPYALSNPVLTPAVIEQVDSGAKNVLNSIASTESSGSLSWTAASDGTITVNGTNDTGGRVDIHLFGIGYLPNIYSGMILSGCKNGQSSSYYILALYSNDGIAWESEKAQYDAPIIIKDSPYCRISIMVSKDSTLNNVVFKPMICTAQDWAISQKFVPYAPTNRELYESDKVIDISNAITAATGYTVESTTHLYYQNKQVFGTIAIAINSGSYSSSLTAIAKLPVEYAPARQYLGSCGFSTDQWAITNIGYAFIQAANASSTAQRGQISVKSLTANLTHMILNVCYPVQFDEVLAVT